VPYLVSIFIRVFDRYFGISFACTRAKTAKFVDALISSAHRSFSLLFPPSLHPRMHFARGNAISQIDIWTKGCCAQNIRDRSADGARHPRPLIVKFFLSPISTAADSVSRF
jgi:hypothetical protein